jgi:hypothetical protein
MSSQFANVIKIEAQPFVEKPIIHSSKKLYVDESAKVELTSSTADAIIYYTIDGSEPNKNSILYKEPIILNTSTFLKAKAFKNGLLESLTLGRQINIIDSKINGLNYKYYEGKWEKLPDFTNLKPLRTGKVFDIDLSEINPSEDYYGIVYEGSIKIEKDGDYIFYIKSDDGSRFILNGREIINNDGLHGAIEKSGKIRLKKGLYPVKIEFFEYTGEQALELFYEGPGIEKQNIPPALFYLNN